MSISRSRMLVAGVLALVLTGCSSTIAGQGEPAGSRGTGLTTLWQRKLSSGDNGEQLTAGTSDGTRYYTGDLGGDVWALSVRTGAVQWHAKGGARTAQGVGVEDGVVFDYDTDTGITALDASSGTQLWHSRDGDGGTGETFVPAYAKGVVVIDTAAEGQSGGLVGVDARTGTRRWALSPSTYGTGTVSTVSDGSTFYAVVDVASSGAERLLALSPTTGRVLWSASLGRDADDDTLVPVPGLLLVLTGDEDSRPTPVTAYDTRTHAVRWRASFTGILAPTSAHVRDGTTLVYPTNNGLRGFSLSDGKTLFTVKMDGHGGGATSIGTCGTHACSVGVVQITVIDAKGKVLARHSAPTPRDEPAYPVVNGAGRTYFFGGNGVVYQLG